MAKLIIFFILLLFTVLLLLACLVQGGTALVQKLRDRPAGPALARLVKCLACAALGAVATAGFVAFTQATASTPPITAAPGAQSIAELTAVDLNGRKEWVSIRGTDTNKPILLFLAGGPGGTHLAFFREYMPYLEDDFVVVNWDQPGAGKSYRAAKAQDLTLEMYIEDGVALTQYLCQRFGQEKIFLLGESWGSALGVFMAQRYPEGYHAFFGTGQMVAFLETEKIDYELALRLAGEAGRTELVRTLEENGPPPYEEGVALKSAAYLGYLDEVMMQDPRLARAEGNKMLSDITASEYGLLDRLYYFLGLYTTFGTFYPQLYGVDLRQDAPRLEVPAYFLLGRLDINAPLPLAQEYYDLLEAPHKELVWFEHSPHAPWAYEREAFFDTLVKAAADTLQKTA